MASIAASCPAQEQDDRKSAALAALRARPLDGTEPVARFALARDILRSGAMKQAGLGAEQVVVDDPSHVPVFFLDGEEHKRKRGAIARFFTPKAISTRHALVMETMADELMGELRATGRGQLDRMSWMMAVVVASAIVGLTSSDRDRMAKRLEGVLKQTDLFGMKGVKLFFAGIAARIAVMKFLFLDVRPAIRERRAKPQEDVISHLIQEGYSEPAILIECMTYASAGMATTREFITMVAWHLFDRPELRQRYLDGDEEAQMEILEEILRLEPVAAFLYRRSEDEVPAALAGEVTPRRTYSLDVRQANVDEAATGPCPFAIDPGRGKRMKAGGPFIAFGDGAHRCPGAQVALVETRIFIDRLFRVPGIRLARVPDMQWNDTLMSYELRGAMVACDRGSFLPSP